MHVAVRLGSILAAVLVLSALAHAVTTAGRQEPLPLVGSSIPRYPLLSAEVYRLTPGGDSLRALEPSSLADQPGATRVTGLRPTSRQDTTVIPTADGRRYLVVNVVPGRSWSQARDETLQLFDARTGRQLSRSHHPAVPLGIIGVSADGASAYGFLISRQDGMCAPARFYLISTGTGAAIRHVTLDTPPWSPMVVDPSLRYLYTMTSYDGAASCRESIPRHPVVSTYDLHTGRRTHNVELTGMPAGEWRTQRIVNGSPVIAMWTPGFALSPDGKQIAILDGHSDTLTILAAPSLRVEGSQTIARPASAPGRLLSALGLSPGAAAAKGQSLGMELQVQYMPTGRSLLVTGIQFSPNARKLAGSARSLGLRLIDIATGKLTARLSGTGRNEAAWPAPDGSAIYSEVQEWGNGAGSEVILRRHDPATLHVLARRVFPHTIWVSLQFLRKR